jgi:diguanylate cyclase (GGDEF)-like protein
MSKDITILYVEDEAQIRENMKRPLDYLCNRLVVGCDGKEGLELYKESRPDIVITDIKMPEMNGIEMAKAIKDIYPKQHIVFITAHSENTYFMDAIDMQVDGYILKPIDYDLLEKKIGEIIEQIKIEKELHDHKVLTKEITKLQDNLLVVLDERNDMIFSNDNFIEFFELDNLASFKRKYSTLATLFLENEEFFVPKDTSCDNWIEEIQLFPKSHRVVSMLNHDLSIAQSFIVSIVKIEETSHTIIIFTDITNLTLEKKEFEQMAFTDELTGSYNRAYFNDIISKKVALYKKDKTSLSFIMIDIDKFKNYNDTYGHQVGDEILIELADLIQKNSRRTDTFARWGGEEFVSVLSGLTLHETITIAEHLRRKIESHVFTENLKVTCSFGVSQFREDDTKESLMKRADEALYNAKANGRNRVEVKI